MRWNITKLLGASFVLLLLFFSNIAIVSAADISEQTRIPDWWCLHSMHASTRGMPEEQIAQLKEKDEREIAAARLKAENGDVPATLSLCCYMQHPFAAPNYPDAAKWCRKAADMGYVGAEMQLAALDSGVPGVTANNTEAIKLLIDAADHGPPYLGNAAETLAFIYNFGADGVKPDYKEAFFWEMVESLQTGQARSAAMKHLSAEEIDKEKKRVNEWARAHAGVLQQRAKGSPIEGSLKQ